MYSCAPYATASGFVELPYLLLQSAVFMPITYWMIGFEANAAKFFFFWLVFLMALTLNTFLGQLLVMVTPSQQVGQLLGSGGLPSSFCCSSSHPSAYVLSLAVLLLLEHLFGPITPASKWGRLRWDLFFCCFFILLLLPVLSLLVSQRWYVVINSSLCSCFCLMFCFSLSLA